MIVNRDSWKFPVALQVNYCEEIPASIAIHYAELFRLFQSYLEQFSLA